jgi:hypothetical protein
VCVHVCVCDFQNQLLNHSDTVSLAIIFIWL